MQLLTSKTDFLAPQWANNVLAIGNFDGVHLGHRAVLRQAKARAQHKNCAFGVLSFEPHPRSFFQPDTPLFRLTPPAQKARLFELMGADFTALLPFDQDLASLEAADFLAELVRGWLQAAHIVVGFDFHFGKGRGGSPAYLADWGAQNSVGIDVVAAETALNAPVSSSRIRKALLEGDVALANGLLGYRYNFTSVVEHGAKRGRELGFPTANLALPDMPSLKHGIYAVRAKLNGQIIQGVASFGRRPQFDNGAPLFEVYLFDFQGDVYGQTMQVELAAFLRPEAKFAGVEALIAQMRQDCVAAKAKLASDTVPSLYDIESL